MNPADYHPARIAKADKDFSKTLDFKDIIFPVKIRDILKIENKNSTGISVFAYEKKEKNPTYVSGKRCEEKHGDLLLIAEVEKSTMFLSKILIDSCTIINYIVEENIFVVLVYMLILQKKF